MQEQFSTSSNDGGPRLSHPKHQVSAMYNGHLLTSSDRAVIVHQPGDPARVFFPSEGVGLESLVPTEFTREVPGYGLARFYTLNRDRSVIEHAAWSFDDPPPGLEQLRGMVTFDLDVVTIEADESDDALWDSEAERMSDYIRHTDSGSGRSQDAPWAANVATPGDDLGEIEDDEERDENLFNRGSTT